jgi:hypothetical protein
MVNSNRILNFGDSDLLAITVLDNGRDIGVFAPRALGRVVRRDGLILGGDSNRFLDISRSDGRVSHRGR